MVAAAATPGLARGDSTAASQCISAAEQSQPLRDQGKLRAAREKLLICSQPDCPSFVRNDCTKWLADLDSALPKIVFGAVDSTGADLVDVRVWLDGKVVAERLDGSDMEVDPGAHTVRFEHAGSAPVEEQVVVRVGDRHRNVSATFASSATPAPTPQATPQHEDHVGKEGGRSLVLPIALLGAGAASVGVASFFWLSGLSDHSTMASGCATNHSCSQSAVNSAQSKLVIGDVLGGVGIVAAAVGVGILVFGGPQQQASTSTGAAFYVQPGPGGAAVGVLGRF
jgi:hypothetical protein